jgi:hypothetical protein
MTKAMRGGLWAGGEGGEGFVVLFEEEDGVGEGVGFGPSALELVGVDAGEVAAGFDFDGAGGGGGEVLEGGGNVGEGDDGVDAEGGEREEVEEGRAGMGEEVAAVDGEGEEVMGVGEMLGEAGAGDGTVDFVEVDGELRIWLANIRWQGCDGDGEGGGGEGPGAAVGTEDGGGTLGGRLDGADGEEGLDDGAVVADEFEVAARVMGEGVEIDAGAELDEDAAAGTF